MLQFFGEESVTNERNLTRGAININGAAGCVWLK